MIQEERMMIVMLAAKTNRQYRLGEDYKASLRANAWDFVYNTGKMYSVSQAMSWISAEAHKQSKANKLRYTKPTSGRIKDKRGVYTQLTMF